MKQFATYFTHGLPGGASRRRTIHHAQAASEIMDALDRFFEQPAPAAL